MKIPDSIVPDAYAIAKQTYHGNTSLTEGVDSLVSMHGLNSNSARDYIINFRHMMDGRGFHRTLNAFSMEYFLKRIQLEYEVERLKNALTALREHILYYQSIQRTPVTMKAMWAIYDRYTTLLPALTKDEVEQDELEAITTINQTKINIIQSLLRIQPTDPQTITNNRRQYKRDNYTIALLKILRDHKCQICQTTIRKKNGQFYIEGAHITPKSMQGPETPDNILILCPNHHKEFDYGDKEIITRDQNEVVFIMTDQTYTIDLRLV